ncbi:MTH1187 family thiamine-binding protein [Gemmatimonadota bacterium]
MTTGLYATGEIQVIPLGAGVSVRTEVKRAHRIIEESGLTVTLHANGTNVEGEIGLILETIRAVHETLHEEGTVRLVSYVKIATRTDKTPTLEGKLF